jgi:hypothetical protein
MINARNVIDILRFTRHCLHRSRRSVPSNWAAENLTCTTAPAGGDPRWHNVTAAAEFPFPDPPHSWALWNVTDLLITQLGRGETELNLALGPGREECEPVHLLASSSIDKPYLEVEYV